MSGPTRARRIALPGEPLVDGATALRPWRDSDADELVDVVQDPEISRWTNVPARYGPSEARAFLITRHDAVAAGIGAPFAILDAETGAIAGSVALWRFAWRHRRTEVGYWLGGDARGRGHATRAVGLICRWAFAALGMERIVLLAATGNPASQRVAERAGFTREAVLRSYLQGTDGRQDMVCFGLLAGDAER